MKIALIAAVAKNRVIGKANDLPWRIPEDMKRFKQLTMGHAILMGRRTFESLRRPLPGRRMLVVSSSSIPGVESYRSPEEALKAVSQEEWVFVIGGAALFRHFLERCDALYLTLVDQEPEGDVHFPPYEHLLGSRYVLQKKEEHEGYCFADYFLKG